MKPRNFPERVRQRRIRALKRLVSSASYNGRIPDAERRDMLKRFGPDFVADEAARRQKRALREADALNLAIGAPAREARSKKHGGKVARQAALTSTRRWLNCPRCTPTHGTVSTAA